MLLSLHDSRYRLKFTEFLKVFIQQHFHRFESDASFPVFAFLELLFRFTHRQVWSCSCEGMACSSRRHSFSLNDHTVQPSMEGLQECLGIWNRLLEYLVTCKEKGALSISEKYKTGLLSFAEELSKKVSFIENSSALNELDDESEDDNVGGGPCVHLLFVGELCRISSFYIQGQTEFDIFFGEYLELSHKLAVLYPTEHVGSLVC